VSSSQPPPAAEFVAPRRLTAVVRVWAEVSLSVVTCKCMRPDPVPVTVVAAAAAAAKAALARVPQLLTHASGFRNFLDSRNIRILTD
jgi:hypothetical protein